MTYLYIKLPMKGTVRLAANDADMLRAPPVARLRIKVVPNNVTNNQQALFERACLREMVPDWLDD
jgi:hypothetical protein